MGEVDEVLLEARGVTRGYGAGPARIEVLRGIDLALRRGETVAVVGASGVGKSTLLHILGGLDRADSGSVLYRGLDLTAMPPAARARHRNRAVGFVFQFHHLLGDLSALENVMLPRLIAGEGRSAARTRALALLEEVGLGGRAGHRPAELSGGEQQRVAIARAFASEPELVLADEPTGNLDARSGEAVFELFAARVAARRLSAVLVTHNDALARRAGRVLRLTPAGLLPA